MAPCLGEEEVTGSPSRKVRARLVQGLSMLRAVLLASSALEGRLNLTRLWLRRKEMSGQRFELRQMKMLRLAWSILERCDFAPVLQLGPMHLVEAAVLDARGHQGLWAAA